jgi:hypothetical protein
VTIECFWVEGVGDSQSGDRRWTRPGHDDGWTDYTLPPGAMLDAVWYHDTAYVGDDGTSLVVVLPPGKHRSDNGLVDNRGNWWNVDGPNFNGAKWQRTGDPRNPATLSITPSIDTTEYHGFVTGGMLTDDLGGHVQP